MRCVRPGLPRIDINLNEPNALACNRGTIDMTLRNVYTTRSVAETWRLANRLAKAHYPQGGVLALYGHLGCGKTTLVQGLAHALGICQPVTSPTFALVNCYEAPGIRLVHMDLYRLDSEMSLWSIDFDDYLEAANTLVAIEWPERAGENLPDGTRRIRIMPGKHPSDRLIRIDPPLP